MFFFFMTQYITTKNILYTKISLLNAINNDNRLNIVTILKMIKEYKN